jgi:hypothetical protein
MDIDDDLKDLLDQLEDDDPNQTDNILPINESTNEQHSINEEIINQDKPSEVESEVESNILDEVPSSALRPVKQSFKRLDETPALDDSKIAESTDVLKYLEKMDEVADEVLISCRNDRQEAQDVINMLRLQCDEAHNKDRPPARMYVDGLVKAVEVKASINGNAVKVMEGVAKMIAATKAGVNIQNNNLSVSGSELDDILSGSEPMGGELD